MQIGDFLLKEQIPVNSSDGILFYAENSITHEDAVLKININNSVEKLARFNRENKILYELSSNNGIIRPLTRVCTDKFNNEDKFYYAMERAETNLEKFQYNLSLNNFTNKINVFLQICEALQHSHKNGYIHRDLHCGNVLVNISPTMQVKLIDFGRAYDLNTHIDLSTVSTWGYLVMPPEIRFGLISDLSELNYFRGDIFALGILWKYLFCSDIDVICQMFAVAKSSISFIQSKSINYYNNTTQGKRLSYYKEWLNINSSLFINIYEIANFDIELANKMTSICKLMLNFNPEERTDNVQDIINLTKGLK